MGDSAKTMRDIFGEVLCELSTEDERIVVVDADVAHPTRAHFFEEKFPDRFVQLGVAEQNVVGFAAGLSTLGFVPLVNMLACFAAKRVCDQVSISVAYPKLNVKICASYAGLTTPNTGATHQSVQDISIMRAMPNMVVIEPADGLELRQALKVAVSYQGPVYFRVVRCQVPDISSPDYRFRLGKGTVLRDGSDITLIGSGLMTSRCLQAAEILSDQDINAQVINMSTLKPIDEQLIIQAAKKTGLVVTAENHSITGGLGSAVSEVLGEHYPTPIKRVGIRDSFGESGKLEGLLEKFGLTSGNVIKAARELLGRKGSE